MAFCRLVCMAIKYRIKIALVHGGADVEQTEFAVFNFVGIRYFSVNGIPTLKPRYRFLNNGYRFKFAVGLYRSVNSILCSINTVV